MKTVAICFCVFLCVATSTNSVEAYTRCYCCMNPNYGRSHWEVAQIPVWANTNNLPGGVTEAQFLTALQNAINTWNGAGANISFHYQGTFGTEACSPTGFTDCTDPGSPCKPTYVNVVGFTTNLLFDQLLVFEPGVEVAIEPTLGEEFDTCVHVSGKTLAYSVALNKQIPFSVDPRPDQFDVETVVLHELGHVLGLFHSEFRKAVMWESVAPGEKRRQLHKDDKRGIRCIYPPQKDASECPTLTQWGLIILVALIVFSTWVVLRRRKVIGVRG